MTTLTIDLSTINTARAEMICGTILAFARANESGFAEEDVPAPPAIDPAAAFGAIPTGKIAEAGPTLVVPSDPPNPAVLANIAVPAASAVTSTVDSQGLPWDARIHASSKAQNADGTWRLKRGLQKDYLDKVTAELRQVMAIPAPSPGPQLVPPPPPAPQAAAVPPPPPPADQETTREQYIALFNRVSAAMSNGKLSQTQLDTCLQGIGVPSLPLLGARLDLVPQACALIDGVIAGASA